MTQNEMFGSAKWVAPETGCDQPYIRGEFNAQSIESAEITICGLGFFEMTVNGKRVSEDLLVPAWTDYEDHRFECSGSAVTDRFSHRIYCLKYDLTPFIKEGKNAVGVMLGGGWYRRIGYGEAKLCYFITLTGKGGTKQTVISDESLKWVQSPITASRVLYGETHDYTLEIPGWNLIDYDTSIWKNVTVVPSPETEFYIQECPSDKVIRYLTPRLVKKFRKYSIYDAGENMTGWPVITCAGKKGRKVVAQYAEVLKKQGYLNSASYTYKHSRKRMQTDVYITDGSAREYHPRFTWHAFRYFSLTNNAAVKTCAVIHSDVAVTSSFECDDKSLNWLYAAYVRTQLFNMHAGIPSDCPQREGRGYTGDGQLACDAAMLLLDGKEFYRKWLGDIADCQDKATGHVQYTAPYFPSGGGPGGWGCAIVVVPYVFYKHYGETQVLKEFFPRMLEYFRYLEDHSENDLIISDQPWAWCLGDWCTPDKIKIPEPLVNNYFYIKSMETVKEIAALIGEESVIPMLNERIAARKKAIEKVYYNSGTGDFFEDIQGADSFALDIGLGTEKTFNNVIQKYNNLGMVDTGIFGTDILTRVLFERGQGQLAFNLLASKKTTSFNFMMEHNATTLWEYWTGKKSQSHPMFGAVTRYLFYYLLGIRQTEGSTGFQEIIIEPVLVEGMTFAKGHITAASGKIAVAYQKQPGCVEFVIEIPAGVIAGFKIGEEKRELHEGSNTFTVRDEVNR